MLGGLLVPVEGSPPFPHAEAVCHLPQTQPSWQVWCQHLCASSAGLCVAACHPSAEGSTCQWLCAGWAVPGSPLEEKVQSIIKKKKKKKKKNSCCPDFSLFSLKYPIGFNQTQARFTSLVNLGIFWGERNTSCILGFGWGFLTKGIKRRVLPSRFSQVLIALHYVAVCLEQAPSLTSKWPGRGPKPMWLQASGSSAQWIAAALEETDPNPELWNLLHLQKAETLTDSRLVVLRVFSNTVFLGMTK